MRSTPSPSDVKNSGKMPQLMPSLRLFTRPACEAANRLRSRKDVSVKTSRKPSTGAALGAPPASTRTCSRVSRTTRIDSRVPSTA